MRIFVLATAGLVLASCGSDDGITPDDTSDTDVSGNTNTDANTGDDDDDITNTVEKTANLSGIVTDASGSPLSDVNIRFCRGEQCRYVTTEAAGTYEFSETAVAPQSFEVVGPMGSGLATAFAPLNFASQEVRVIDVKLPVESAGVNLGAAMAELDLGDLLITMGTNDLTAPLFVDAATEASATRIPEADWLPTDGVAGTVVAMWFLMPFDHHSDAGMNVRFDLNDLGLTGDVYRAYLGDYATSMWIELGEVTDGGGGVYEGASHLELTSTIILVDES